MSLLSETVSTVLSADILEIDQVNANTVVVDDFVSNTVDVTNLTADNAALTTATINNALITNGSIAYADVLHLTLNDRAVFPRDPLIAVGSAHDIVNSPNGFAFTTVNTALFTGQIGGVAGNQYFWIAVGKQVGGIGVEMAISSDGITWTAHPSPPSVLPPDTVGDYNTIAYSAITNQWVVGTTKHIFRSSDGLTWVLSGGDNLANGVNTLAYANGKWLAGGDNGVDNQNIMYSVNGGLDWTLCAGEKLGTQCFSITGTSSLAVAVGDGSAGNDHVMLVSTDGINWSVPAAPPTNYNWGISVAVNKDGTKWLASGKLAAPGTTPFWYSSDGLNWQNAALSTILDAVIGYDGSKFVVIGVANMVGNSNAAVTYDGFSYVLNPSKLMTVFCNAIAANQERTYLAVV